jgi:hypothetical protein
LVQAVQLRQFGAMKHKYSWLSAGSIDAERVPGLVAESCVKVGGKPAHYANPAAMIETGEAYIVEGGLKAEVASYLSSLGVIGFSGLYAPDDFLFTLREYFPTVRTFHICHDADFEQNEGVSRAALAVADDLQDAGYRVNIGSWSAEMGKGFDDYLLALRATEQLASREEGREVAA